MKITFLGQNCFLIEYQGINILTDPFYNSQKDKSNFDIKNQSIDYVLITHAHQDHVADVEEVLQFHSKATIIAQPEICGYYKADNSVDLNIGGSYTIQGFKVTMVSATHTSSFANGTYGGVASGYILSFDNKKWYLSGDTGVTKDMDLIPQLFGEIDGAILCIGGHYTMDAKQAAFAAKELIKTNKVIGCHFDTFPPIAIDHTKAQEDFSSQGVELILPELGDVLSFD